MEKKIALCTSTLALLAACGGSSTGQSGGSSTDPTIVETLWESPRNTGAGLVRASSNDMNSVALVEDVNNAGRYRSFEVVNVISETDNGDGSYSGEVVVRWDDGTTGNVLGRFYGNANLYLNASGGSTTLVAGGERASNLPVGTYTYSGYAESLYFYNGSEYNEIGTFTMDAQFASQTAQLNANTDESQYFNNNLAINSAGEISGVNGTFIVFDTDGTTELERRNVDFDGTFHSSGATHVSGIAVGGATTTDDFSLIGIVGKR